MSRPADWNVVPGLEAPFFRFGATVLSPHEWRATYLPRPTISLLWGLELDEPHKLAWQPPTWMRLARPKVLETLFTGTSETRGTSIDRYRYTVVDADGCCVPMPTHRRTPDAGGGWQITHYERALFGLLNDLGSASGGGANLDGYLRAAGIDLID